MLEPTAIRAELDRILVHPFCRLPSQQAVPALYRRNSFDNTHESLKEMRSRSLCSTGMLPTIRPSMQRFVLKQDACVRG